MKHCPYCGKKIYADAKECRHCEKSLVKDAGENGDKKQALTSPKAYSEKTVPAWLMYVLVALTLFACYTMFANGCEDEANDSAPENSSEESTTLFDSDDEWRLGSLAYQATDKY